MLGLGKAQLTGKKKKKRNPATAEAARNRGEMFHPPPPNTLPCNDYTCMYRHTHIDRDLSELGRGLRPRSRPGTSQTRSRASDCVAMLQNKRSNCTTPRLLKPLPQGITLSSPPAHPVGGEKLWPLARKTLKAARQLHARKAVRCMHRACTKPHTHTQCTRPFPGPADAVVVVVLVDVISPFLSLSLAQSTGSRNFTQTSARYVCDCDANAQRFPGPRCPGVRFEMHLGVGGVRVVREIREHPWVVEGSGVCCNGSDVQGHLG